MIGPRRLSKAYQCCRRGARYHRCSSGVSRQSTRYHLPSHGQHGFPLPPATCQRPVASRAPPRVPGPPPAAAAPPTPPAQQYQGRGGGRGRGSVIRSPSPQPALHKSHLAPEVGDIGVVSGARLRQLLAQRLVLTRQLRVRLHVTLRSGADQSTDRNRDMWESIR
jgi:hypothetical protein